MNDSKNSRKKTGLAKYSIINISNKEKLYSSKSLT